MTRKNGKNKLIAENLAQIRRLARHGYQTDEICSYLGIDEKLFNEYAVKNDEMAMILKNATIEADLQVEESLLKRAIGYETTEEYEVNIPETGEGYEKGTTRLKEDKQVKKFVPPDATAAMAWLINRRPGRWSKNPTTGGELDNREIVRLKRIAAQEADENM